MPTERQQSVPHMELRQVMLQEQRQKPKPFEIAAMELTARQLCNLIEEIEREIREATTQEYAEGAEEGSYLETSRFADRAQEIAQQSLQNGKTIPEFRVNGNLTVERREIREGVSDSRTLGIILEHYLAKVNPEYFTEQVRADLVKTLQWTIAKKQEILEYLALVHSDYVVSPDNKLLLKEVTEAHIEGMCHVTSEQVKHLLKGLLVIFPDKAIRPARELVPGEKLSKIKGCYALERLKQIPEFFDREKGWCQTRPRIAKEIYRRFGLKYTGKQIGKYIEAIGDESYVQGAWRKEVIKEVDDLIGQYTQREDLFDARQQTWKLRPTQIRRIIREETGWVIPKTWIEALKFANCKGEHTDNLIKRVYQSSTKL